MPDLTNFDLASLLPFIAIGFAAQVVDGALGMAFGVISNTLLLSLGVPPAAASAGVHTVETFTTAVSGISHAIHGNVRWKMFFRLMIPGVIGGALGAYVLSNIDAAVAKPFILAYLSLIGVYLLWRAIRYPPHPREPKIVEPLGFAGGFLDAAGGGGWGPVVTTTLLGRGHGARETVGSVNTSEFLVTAAISVSFFLTLGSVHWSDVIGLLVGGVLAAPIAAYVVSIAQPRVLLGTIGCFIVSLALYKLVLTIDPHLTFLASLWRTAG